MTIVLVVFDIAGTTVRDDNAVNRCLRAALADAGLAVDGAAVDAVMGLRKPEAIRRLVEGSPARDWLRPRIDAIHADFATRMCRFYSDDPGVTEIPGAAATFARLRRAGICVGLDTGFDRRILDVVLARMGWEGGGLVDAAVASDEVAHGRPQPDMIRHLMERLGIDDPARVAKVGDTPADVLEGANAGCRINVGVASGSHSREQLERLPHSHIISSVRELPDVLGL